MGASAVTNNAHALHQIIYLSRLTQDEDPAIKDILAKALLNNPRNDVTGMMLYADGDILQVLEGPKEAITALFKKIQRDARHTDVYIVLDEPLQARHFPEWSMGYKKLGLLDKADFLNYRQVFRGTPDAIAQRSRAGVASDVIRAFCAWAMSR